MTARTLDVSELPDFAISNQAPVWWGQLLLCFIEGAMFCILIAVYFYIRLSVDMWPPAGTQLPHLTVSSLAFIPLLISTVGSYLASEAAKKGERWGMFRGLLLNFVCALIFLAMRFWVWYTFNFTYATDAHGSAVWTILWLHTYDMVADVIFTAVLLLLLLIGWSGPAQRIAVHVDSVVWYFLVLIWIPLYVTIYWAPRFVGAPA